MLTLCATSLKTPSQLLTSTLNVFLLILVLSTLDFSYFSPCVEHIDSQFVCRAGLEKKSWRSPCGFSGIAFAHAFKVMTIEEFMERDGNTKNRLYVSELEHKPRDLGMRHELVVVAESNSGISILLKQVTRSSLSPPLQ